jgi:hypothetical protein
MGQPIAHRKCIEQAGRHRMWRLQLTDVQARDSVSQSHLRIMCRCGGYAGSVTWTERRPLRRPPGLRPSTSRSPAVRRRCRRECPRNVATNVATGTTCSSCRIPMVKPRMSLAASEDFNPKVGGSIPSPAPLDVGGRKRRSPDTVARRTIRTWDGRGKRGRPQRGRRSGSRAYGRRMRFASAAHS